MNGKRVRKNVHVITQKERHAYMRALDAEEEQRRKRAHDIRVEEKDKYFVVDFYAPAVGRRITPGGGPIRAATKGAAIAQLRAWLKHQRPHWHEFKGATNFIATERKANPDASVVPYFCADCPTELRGKSVRLSDGRHVCPRCARLAKEKSRDKKQSRLFEDQSSLFHNGQPRRNVEMGFIDRVGTFHPIRKSTDYNEFRSGDFDSPAEKRDRSLRHQAKLTREWYADEEKKLAKKFATKHRSLSQFVRGAGGINAPKGHDLSGELRQLGRRESGTTGLLNQTNRIGRHRFGPEHMMDAANAEGFRDRHGREFDNIGNFLTAVADDAGGARKLYSQEAQSSYYNPMTKKKKKAAKGKAARAKKPVCSRCGGAHNVAYCSKPKKNLFGFGKEAKKRRKRKARAKAAYYTALARNPKLKFSRKGAKAQSPKAKQARVKKPQPRQVFYFEVKTKRRRVQGIVSAPNMTGATKRLKDHYGAQGIRHIAVRNPTNLKALAQLGVIKNPMNILEIGSHVANMLGGFEVARKLTRKPAKQRKPTAKAAARRLAERRHQKNGLIEVAAGLQAANYLEKELRSATSKRKNPDNGNTPALRAIHEDFLGRRNTGRVMNLFTPPGSPKKAGAMAKFTAVHVVLKRNGRTVVQPFAKGSAWIGGVQNGDWRRMVIGLKQPFAMPNGLDPDKPYDYGEVVRIEYLARKPHLYGKDSPEYPFFHEMGEEGGKRPHLILQNGCLAFRGGGYGIKREGIRN